MTAPSNVDIYLKSVEFFKENIADKDKAKTAAADTELDLKKHFDLSRVNQKIMLGLKTYHTLPDRKDKVKEYVDEFFSKPIPDDITSYRDVFYTFKHKIQVYQYPTQDAKAFSNAVTNEVSDLVWDRFLAGHKDIYTDIGIEFEQAKTGDIPVVMFIEKKKRDLDDIREVIPTASYMARGTSNKFELALLAKHITGYLTETSPEFYRRSRSYDGTVYLVSIADHDPAGLEIKKSLYDNLLLALQVFDPDVELIHIPIDYSSLIDRGYGSYRLSPHEANKDIWEDAGLFGMELNVIPKPVRMEFLTKAIDRYLPKSIYELVAKREKRDDIISTVLSKSKKYQKLRTKLVKLEMKLLADAGKMDNYDFDEDRVNNLFEDDAALMDFSTYLKRKIDDS